MQDSGTNNTLAVSYMIEVIYRYHIKPKKEYLYFFLLNGKKDDNDDDERCRENNRIRLNRQWLNCQVSVFVGKLAT